jgi:SAM-dependent methyltransferase
VEAGRIWCEILAPHLPAGGDNRVLDLGAGTGRFATLFARTFEGQIVGVEPSRGMLAEAIQDVRPRNLMYVAGSAERIPLANHSCDVAWLSQIWHHVRDHQAGARELRRVLRPGGVLLLRGTFGDQLDGFPTLFRFWPEARDICKGLPSLRETRARFQANGFVLTEHRRVSQVTCGSLREFAARTALRADSALSLISDAIFQRGQAALDQAAAREHEPLPVIEVIDLLILRKGLEMSFSPPTQVD